MFCIVLYCNVLYCIVLYCNVLYCVLVFNAIFLKHAEYEDFTFLCVVSVDIQTLGLVFLNPMLGILDKP